MRRSTPGATPRPERFGSTPCGLRFPPQTYPSMQRGDNQLIDAIRPTLGPIPRITAIDRTLDTRVPELLDNGGLIAKRIIQIPDVYEDVGAMFVRDFLWQLQDQEGDGTATAAVLFQKVLNEGIRHVAAGHNARRIQTFLQEGLRLIISELSRMASPLRGKTQAAQVAYTVSHDSELSEILGEIFDIIGDYGRLEIRKDHGRGLDREYVEGMYWQRGLVSREMLSAGNGAGQSQGSRARTELENAAILISDLDILEPQDLLPVLTCALQNDLRRLLILATEISGNAIALLLANNRKPEELQLLAVKTPGYGPEDKAWFLEDMATLCGGQIFAKAAGDSLRTIRPEHFGRARRVWAGYENFGIIGGRGDPRRLRRHIGSLRTAFDDSVDIVQRGKLHKRIGKLLGGSATLRIGGISEHEIEERTELAGRTADAVRGALREGVVAGGGTALLSCRTVLEEALHRAQVEEERVAYRILIAAMAEPLRTIAGNAGYDGGTVLAQVQRAGPDHGFDARSGEVVYMPEAGIVDPASVQKAAVYAGISSAALALTIDVLVHRRQQPTRATPRGPGKRKKL